MHASLVNILRCPDDGNPGLEFTPGEKATLRCPACERRFPIVDGIPSLLPRDLAAAVVGGVVEPDDDALTQLRARDDEAGLYDELYDNPAFRFELETYAARIDLQPGELALDVGCGTGRVVKEYVGAEGRVVAADYSLESLRRFGARLDTSSRGRVHLAHCAVEQLPFPDRHFDVVVATSLFSNLPTWEARDTGLLEVHRVLRSGGRLLVTVYNHCWTKRLRHSVGLSKSGLKQGYQSGGRIPYYNFDPAEFSAWISTRFRPGPVFGLNHRVPVISPMSRQLAATLDRLLYHTPFTLRVFAKEMGLVAVKD